ncbi:hypothetical protein Leryth_015166 [Lithospermum erythrorhizon]|nr:hypothetical protein Leryth_015166 [Lithospermum erythrorhizon]
MYRREIEEISTKQEGGSSPNDTAIQVYHLQARLGLDQPSKVVDWLLNAAKDDIDELPPLQIPPGVFIPQNLDDLMSNTYKDMVQEKRGYVEEGGESSKCLESGMLQICCHYLMQVNLLMKIINTTIFMLAIIYCYPLPAHLKGLAHQSYFSSNDNVSVEDFEGSKHFGFQMFSSNSFHHHQQASQHQEQNVRPFQISMMDNRERETTNESEYDCSR